MIKNELNVAIIGAGAVAEIFHFPALTRIPGFKIKYIMDLKKERLERIKTIFNFKTTYTSSLDDVLNHSKDLDAIFILTPPKFHKDLILKSFENDLHVFCEKPLAMNYVETQEIIQKARKTGKILQVGFNLRFSPQYKEVNTILNKEMIGTLYFYSSTLFANAFQWPSVSKFIKDHKMGGGALFEMGIHHLDLLIWLLGVKNIDLKDFTLFFDKKRSIDVGAAISFKLKNGGFANITIGWNNQSINELFIYGDKGKIYTNLSKNEVLIYPEKLIAQPPIRKRTDVGVSPYARELLHFYKVIKGKENLIFNYDEYLAVADIVDNIYKSVSLFDDDMKK